MAGSPPRLLAMPPAVHDSKTMPPGEQLPCSTFPDTVREPTDAGQDTAGSSEQPHRGKPSSDPPSGQGVRLPPYPADAAPEHLTSNRTLLAWTDPGPVRRTL